MGAKIKAYEISTYSGGYLTVVFAQNAREAKATALSSIIFNDVIAIGNMDVRRFPKADKLYKGQREIDWYDPDVRLMLVKDFDWSCAERPDPDDCDKCPVRKYCFVGKSKVYIHPGFAAQTNRVRE